ncbi:MAG: type III-B CRISPR-associated protein Cas10/Cmr2 [Rhodopirellula sp.]|nr:type III-B CRISPR-associated protein Cas10/Cmr2 [Rhodopirellula sp.]
MNDAQDLLIAWLHDPPDKALDIQRHVGRACRYLSSALRSPVEPSMLQQNYADQMASATERLPMPRWEADARTVVGADQLRLLHPLSGDNADEDPIHRQRDLRENEILSAIEELLDGVDDPVSRFLVLWRMLPERLATVRPVYGCLPADTRVPDHTIWQHLDTTAGLHQVLGDSQGGAFLCFSIGPVQSFIATARTVRDLWTGSMILSWLTFRAMLPVVGELGPTALIYPSLRGIPLLDLWLCRQPGLRGKINLAGVFARKMPCIPNRFVAMVPWGESGSQAGQLADACRGAAAEAWREMAAAVHGELDARLSNWDADWDRHWQGQIDGFFDLRTSLLPWRQCDDAVLARLVGGGKPFDDAFPDAANVRKLETSIPEGHRVSYSQRSAGQWQFRLELSARLLEADKGIRHVPPAADVEEREWTAAKCSMMGTVEQMGPPESADAARFWKQVVADVQIGGVRVRAGEQLGAVALVKRFAGPASFCQELELADPRQLRFDDTATIAAASWLQRARAKGFDWLDPQRVRDRFDQWSGQWLHASGQKAAGDDEKCPPEVWRQICAARKDPELGAPPVYYGVLMMDGDSLGEWLSGKKSPQVRDVLHPQVREYFEQFPEAAAGLDARRPVTPALHAAISEALANFALCFVPEIVTRHRGTLIYAGGDDVLALLPTAGAIRCAHELQETYRRPWQVDRAGQRRLLMGPRATLSAGLAVVHHKEDLRFALKAARDAEQGAKRSGRDTLRIAACRRSGEHASALCPWPFSATVNRWTDAFQNSASDRWAYHLRSSLVTLRGLKPEAMEAEIRRQMNRCERETRTLFDDGSGDKAGEELVAAFRSYRSYEKPDGSPRFQDIGDALEGFITLCQTASFLARGTDA